MIDVVESEKILALVARLKDGSNWLSGRNGVYSYNRAPKKAAEVLRVLVSEGVVISGLIHDLRAPHDWKLEGYGHWKDVTTMDSNAPFEAADVLESSLGGIVESLHQQLATMETRIAEACAKMALDYYPAPTEDIRAGISKAINAGEWREYL